MEKKYQFKINAPGFKAEAKAIVEHEEANMAFVEWLQREQRIFRIAKAMAEQWGNPKKVIKQLELF